MFNDFSSAFKYQASVPKDFSFVLKDLASMLKYFSFVLRVLALFPIYGLIPRLK